MSRIGKMPVGIPDTVTVTVEDSRVRVKGPKGEVAIPLHRDVTVRLEAEPKQLAIDVRNAEDQDCRALWGLTRQLISNAVAGVQKPYEKSLEFIGVGYKANVSGNEIKMDVGYSHPVVFPLPEGMEAKMEKNVLTISGIDKQMVGEIAARIRRVRPPEPYKGKGIKYTTETIRRKAGKATLKGA